MLFDVRFQFYNNDVELKPAAAAAGAVFMLYSLQGSRKFSEFSFFVSGGFYRSEGIPSSVDVAWLCKSGLAGALEGGAGGQKVSHVDPWNI